MLNTGVRDNARTRESGLSCIDDGRGSRGGPCSRRRHRRHRGWTPGWSSRHRYCTAGSDEGWCNRERDADAVPRSPSRVRPVPSTRIIISIILVSPVHCQRFFYVIWCCVTSSFHPATSIGWILLRVTGPLAVHIYIGIVNAIILVLCSGDVYSVSIISIL
jgi:hypothetical protein